MIFVINVVITPDPIQDPHAANEMITAADVTSSAVVVILFGTIIAVWAAVEGVPLLWKDSGFGKGHVLPVWYIFYLFLP